MNNNFDFNKYDDLALATKYDGFIDPSGSFYKVARRNSKKEIDHDLWAGYYIGKYNDKLKSMDFSHSGLFTLSKISSPWEVLVHLYGFIYYSHDALYYGPIIKKPNPKYNSMIMTQEQDDALFQIMLMNNENPFECSIFEDNVYEYSRINDTNFNLGRRR